MQSQHNDDEVVLKETPTAGRGRPTDSAGFDLTLLEDSLAMTPWERMQANDDALNFAESLAAAMKRRHAKSQ
jgi:hypothetical protein